MINRANSSKYHERYKAENDNRANDVVKRFAGLHLQGSLIPRIFFEFSADSTL
jgi:hypothetical protein